MEFTRAYEENVSAVYGFLAYRVSSAEEAEDLTQETFERALKAWPRFDPRNGEPRTWLLVIARNVYVDSRRRSLSTAGGGSGAAEPSTVIAPDGPDPALASAVQRLKRHEREVIALRFGGDLTTAEVAEVMGGSEAAAQQILARSLRRLGTLLKQPGVGQ